MMNIEMIISGFGGQGVLTAGLVAIQVASDLGKNVLWSPSYGSEMRGGTANCNVIISDEETGSPYLPTCDILLALNEPSLDKFANVVRENGIIVVNESIVDANYAYPDNVKVVKVKATGIANDLQNLRGTNLVMLGAFLKATNAFELETFVQGVDNYFAKKGKVNTKNADCIRAGYEAV